MIDAAKFKAKTVYVTYIASTLENVWQALTKPEFTRQYFGGFAVAVEPNEGGTFQLLYPDGRVHVRGEVTEWTPPHRFSCTWLVDGISKFGELPECLVTYEIEQAGDCVRLTMTESHSWDIPDAILSGGRVGWPAILSSLKSVLEIGKPLSVKLEPPKEMIEAVARAVAEKPWLRKH